MLNMKQFGQHINFFTCRNLYPTLLLNILSSRVHWNIDIYLIFCSQSSTVCTWELATTVTTGDLVSSGPTCVSFFLVATSPVDRISVGWGLPAAGQGHRADYSPLFSSIFAESVSVHCSHHTALARSANAEWFTENCLHISTMSNIPFIEHSHYYFLINKVQNQIIPHVFLLILH